MKIKVSFIGVFIAAFLVGCFAFVGYVSLKAFEPTAAKNDSSAVVVPEKDKMSFDTMTTNACCYRDGYTPPPPIEEDLPEEDFDEEEFEPYTIDLLNVGEFHEEEVEAKSGEKWLALFNDDGESSLAWTEIKVSWMRDEISDGQNDRFTEKKVSVKSKSEPILLLKNAPTLKPGKAVTLFDYRKIPEDRNAETVFQNGYKKDFVLNGKTFTLKVVNEHSTTETLSKGSKLILTSGDVEQIVYPNRGERIGEAWYLYWVGDIDGDGKLDFYADLSDHYNSSMPTLFLSSEAEKGKLVKEVAGIRTVGC